VQYREGTSMEFVMSPKLSTANEIGLYLCVVGMIFTSIQATTTAPVMSKHP
jgi:hypothetical protein